MQQLKVAACLPCLLCLFIVLTPCPRARTGTIANWTRGVRTVCDACFLPTGGGRKRRIEPTWSSSQTTNLQNHEGLRSLYLSALWSALEIWHTEDRVCTLEQYPKHRKLQPGYSKHAGGEQHKEGGQSGTSNIITLPTDR